MGRQIHTVNCVLSTNIETEERKLSDYNYGMASNKNWQARMAEDRYQDMRKINSTEMLAEIRGNAKINLELQKIELRQREEEAKRGTYEEIIFDEEGRPYLITRNLWIDAKPREFANLRYPKLICAAKRLCLEEQVFIVSCEVSGIKRTIYLDPKRIGSGTYLLGKLAAAGICIYAPEKRAKQYARLLLSWLIGYAEKSVIADEPGWMEVNGEFTFVAERSMTWLEIKKLL